MDSTISQDTALRFFLFCSRHALLRPIANLVRTLQPLIIAHTRTSQLAEKLSQDPGLPCANPTDSFWQTPPHPDLSSIQSPTLPEKADVVIVGSGITGASTAHYLLSQDSHINVVVCEARTITSGATGRNGGHILDLPYAEYEMEVSLLGKEAAKKLVQFRMAHLSELMQFAKTELSDAAAKASEIRLVETVDAAFDKQQWLEMKQQLALFLHDFPEQRENWREWEGDEARKKFGIEPIFGAISGPAGAIWPYRFVTSVYQNLIARFTDRIKIETKTPVLSIETTAEASDHPFVVTTSRGAIRTKNVIHATNGHAAHLIPRLRGKLFAVRGQMTVQSLSGEHAPPNLGSKRSWLLRHGRGYDYMTQSPGNGDYYLGGGAFQGGNGGHDALGNPSDDQQDFTALCHLRGMLPMMFERQFGQSSPSSALKAAWTGTLGFTCDGRPLVGRIPVKISERHARFTKGTAGAEWISAGFCGDGMVYCWRSGRALASMILGHDVDWFPEALLLTEERYHSSVIKDMTNFWMSLST